MFKINILRCGTIDLQFRKSRNMSLKIPSVTFSPNSRKSEMRSKGNDILLALGRIYTIPSKELS